MVVDFIWLLANCFTFLLRFLIFHYVLFAERTTAARAAATGPDRPRGTRNAPSPAAAPHRGPRRHRGSGSGRTAKSAETAKSAAKTDGAKQATPAE